MNEGRLVRLFGHHPVVSDGFGRWLAGEGVSVLFVAGDRVWIVGRTADGRIDAVDRAFGTPVASIAPSEDGILIAGWQVWRFVDGLTRGTTTPEGHDRLFLPQSAVSVGEIGICDLFDGPDGIIFASSRLGCLAMLDRRWSFRPIWAPPWQSALADEDRCHLGGVTCDNAGRTWVTCAGVSDTAEGWRAGRLGGGCVVGTDGTMLVRGLTLPRTLRTFGDHLLVANAGVSELLSVSLASGQTEVVVGSLPVAAGLAVHRHWAIVGLSGPDRKDFAGLPAIVPGAAPISDGLALVDLDTGRVEGSVHLEGRSQGVASVAVLEATRWPALAVPRGSIARETVSVGPPDLS
jgi:uncharacterized protein (TIGR03032 family)